MSANNGTNEFTATNGNILTQGVSIDAFPGPSGPIGYLIGHFTRINFPSFRVNYTQDMKTGAVSLKKVSLDATKAVPVEYVTVEEVASLTDSGSLKSLFKDYDGSHGKKMSPSDRSIISFKTHDRSYGILNTAESPLIVYNVETETQAEVVGKLTFRGVTEELRCTKHRSSTGGSPLVLDCPFSHTKWGFKAYSAYGLIGVDDIVNIRVTIPDAVKLI